MAVPGAGSSHARRLSGCGSSQCRLVLVTVRSREMQPRDTAAPPPPECSRPSGLLTRRFPVAAVTGGHKCSDLNHASVSPYGQKSSKQGVFSAAFLLQALREKPLLCLFRLLEAPVFLGLWLRPSSSKPLAGLCHLPFSPRLPFLTPTPHFPLAHGKILETTLGPPS